MLLEQLLKSPSINPDRTAVRSGTQSLTYGELAVCSDSLCYLLVNNHSQPLSRIAIYLDKSVPALVSILGALKTGGTYVPIDPLAPVMRVQYILNDADVNIVITDTNKYQELLKTRLPTSVTAFLLVENDGFTDIATPKPPPRTTDSPNHPRQDRYSGKFGRISEEDPAYILYTSGSTGDPKGVVISHRAALTFIKWAGEYFGISQDDVILSLAPFHFDLSIFDIFVSIMSGAELCLAPKGLSSFPLSLKKTIHTHKVTTVYSVPSILTKLLTVNVKNPPELSSLQRIIYAGEPFPIEYLRKLMEQMPNTKFYNLYGPTETNVITYYPIERKPEQSDTSIPIGFPCPWVESRVIDDQGNIIEKTGTGELIVRGDSLMTGYLNKPELTSLAIRPVTLPNGEKQHYYFTGDIVEIKDSGILDFKGRQDRMIKIDGFRVELEEIEATLFRHQSIKECAVKLLKTDNQKPFLKAYVVSDTQLDDRDISTHLKNYLPEYMIPRVIAQLPSLPRTSNGKVDRTKLP